MATEDLTASLAVSVAGGQAADGGESSGLRGVLSREGLETTIAPALFVLVAVVLIVQDQGGYFPTSFGWSALGLLAVVLIWAVAGGLSDAGRGDALFLATLLALAAWAGLSIVWSIDPAQSVLEFERWLVLVGGCGAFLVLARRVALPWLGLALLMAITAISVYSLWTRLVPSAASFAPNDPITGYRLSVPVGYWNALGAFAAIGTLLAFGYVTEQRAAAGARALGAISLTVLPVTLYFTFSRGAWLALAGGAIVAILAAPQRVGFVLEIALFALLPAVGVLVASRSKALVDQTALLADATHQGRHLGVIVVGLAALGAIIAVPAVIWAERHLALRANTHRALGAALLVCFAAALAVAIVRGGGPLAVARRGYDSFVTTAPPVQGANLNSRLFNVNGDGRPRMWSVAIDALHGHWLLGRGAGSFQRSWDRSRRANEVVRDAHSLYVETLSELGVLGLALLAVVLLAPLAVAVRARSLPLVPAILGAYVAFLLHNGIDWDWELSGIALSGLLLGCLLLVAGRRGRVRTVARLGRLAAAAAAAAAAVFALVAVIGNGALAGAQTANSEKRYAAALADAELARTWMPWSAEPLKALGEAQLEQGQVAAAKVSFQHAVSVDPADWQSWLDLAATVTGAAQRRAVASAKLLYPRSPEVAEFLAALPH